MNQNKNNFEGEVQKFLLDGEVILWSRSEVVNLMRMSLWIFLITVVSIMFVSSLFMVSSLVDILFYTLTTAIALGVMIALALNEYKKRLRITNLSRKELKNYLCYDILTNKRYIRKNYTQNFGKDIDFSDYPSEALFFKDDKLILDLSYVEVIYVNRLQQNFCFWVEKANNEDFARSMILKYFDDSEYGEIIDSLDSVLHLEIHDQSPSFIEFHSQTFMKSSETRKDKEDLEVKLDQSIQKVVERRRNRNYIIIFSLVISIPSIFLIINMFWAMHLAQIEASSSLRDMASFLFMILILSIFVIGVVFYIIDKKFGFTIKR